MASRYQIKEAVKILKEACNENFEMFKSELQQDLESLEKYIQSSDQAYQLINNDMGKSLASGFDEKFFEVTKVSHNQNVEEFINTWIQRQSDWRYPLLFLCPTTLLYTETGVKSHLVYVLSNKFNINDINHYIQPKLTEQSTPRQYRHKPLEIHGDIPDMHVPYGQIGSIICLDYFPYLSLEQMKNLMFSFNQILKPGGSAFVHFSDADQEREWDSVVAKERTYVTETLINKMATKYDMSCEFYHIEDYYSFVSIKKPGELSSIKKGPTKMEKISD